MTGLLADSRRYPCAPFATGLTASRIPMAFSSAAMLRSSGLPARESTSPSTMRSGVCILWATVNRCASRYGNPGHFRALGRSLYELKIDVGPGYRVYYTVRRDVLIILLAGGDKSSQSRDIRTALALANNL